MNRDHSVVFEIASKYCIWTLLLTTKKQESSRKTSTSALLTMPKPLTTWITINSGKSLKRWEYQTTWPASWETCMQVRKQQLELDMEQELSQRGKGVHQGCTLSPWLFNLYAEYIIWNAGLEETQAGIKIAGRKSNNLRYGDDTTLIAESEEELKSLLMKVKEANLKRVHTVWFQLYDILENSERDENTRAPDLPLEKSVCRSGSNS